jgi:hypothetical protein
MTSASTSQEKATSETCLTEAEFAAATGQELETVHEWCIQQRIVGWAIGSEVTTCELFYVIPNAELKRFRSEGLLPIGPQTVVIHELLIDYHST